MKSLLLALLFVFLTSPALAVERGPKTNPPNDKPTGVVSLPSADLRGEGHGLLWYVGYAGYFVAGPFMTAQACEVAKRRFPVRYRCVPIRD